MTPASSAWKAAELRVCRAWNGQRRGPSFGQQCSDCVGAPVSLEVTRTERGLAAVIKRKWGQCQRNAKLDGKSPVLVVAAPRQRVDDMVCVVNHGWLLDVCRKAGVIV